MSLDGAQVDGAQVDGVQPGVQRASQIQAAIAALEVQRPVLGDDIVDLAVAPLRAALQVADGDAGDLPQIKHLTILFVDVVGSTATGQTMHPEDFNDLMEAAMRSFTGTIQAHNGEVLKYTGDGLLATFGGQQARDDDAENAVLAGLSILDEARRIAVDIAASLNASFNVRVGVDTGTVLLGGGVEGSSNIRGNAVNLAARMEQAAPINGLRISHHTYQLVRGLFDVVEERSTQVKGIATPIPTFVVVGRAAADGSAPHRNDDYTVPMIAREAELNLLCEAFLHTPDLLGPRFITIVAEGGVGKSRLVREFALWLAARSPQATMLVAAAVPQSVQRPFGMLRSLLVSRCGITDSDTAEIARQKLRDTLIPLFDGDGEDHIHLLGHLAGFDFSVSPHVRGILNDAAQIRTRAFRAAAQMLRNLASGSEPVVVLLDDLQWADDGLFDLLQHFNDNEPDLSLLVVGAARPGLSDRRPGWTHRLLLEGLQSIRL